MKARAALAALLVTTGATTAACSSDNGDCDPGPLKASAIRLELISGAVIDSQSFAYSTSVNQVGSKLVLTDNATQKVRTLFTVDPLIGQRSDPSASGVQHLYRSGDVELVVGGRLLLGWRQPGSEELWRSTGLGFFASQVVVADGVAYVAGTTGGQPAEQSARVLAVDVSGRKIWSSRILAPLEANRVLVTDEIVVVGEDDRARGGTGAVEAFDRDTGRRVWSTRLDLGRVTHLAAMPGAVVVTQETTAYFCL